MKVLGPPGIANLLIIFSPYLQYICPATKGWMILEGRYSKTTRLGMGVAAPF